MNKFKHVVVEGPLGVGKTTLATMLSNTFHGKNVFEQVDHNPFLDKFYENPRAYAFQTQLYFLLERYRQQEEVSQLSLFSQVAIGDYLFAKDRIFAYVNLSDEEFALYDKLYGMLSVKIPKPDLVVYLQAETPVLIQRIRTRSRSYERGITEEYLTKLNKAYNDFFFYYRDSSLLVVNTSHIDFVKDGQDYQDLLNQILEMGPGTKYYVPAAHRTA